MTRKVPRVLSPPSHSICTLNDDNTYENPNAQSKRQLSLTSFFTAGSKRLRKRTEVATTTFSSRQESDNLTTPATPDNTSQNSSNPNKVSPNNSTTLSGIFPTKRGCDQSTLTEKPKLQQVYLDCGQTMFGQQLCKKCGMLYVPGVAEDAKAHAKICQESKLGILWRKHPRQRMHWKEPGRGGDQICSIPNITKSNQLSPTLEEIYQQVVRDLGLDSNLSAASALMGKTVWIYIRQQRVVGFASTMPISKAYEIQSFETDSTSIGSNYSRPQQDKRQAKRALLGIALLWTHEQYWRQRVATKLVDTARHHSFFGMTVPKGMMAFSSPTTAGWQFGRSYCDGSSDSGPLIFDYRATSLIEEEIQDQLEGVQK